MTDVKPYAVGICAASVCIPRLGLSNEDVERELNAMHPTGISSQWRMSKNKTFATGEPNPCPCNQDAGRVHVLLEC